MTYDKTFCEFYITCQDADDCNRKYTPAVALKVHELCIPVSLYLDKPECYKSINEEQK